MRYQFVDCRWELGAKDRGRELYIAGHIPGASFLDLETDLSDTSIEGQGRHPLPSAARFAEAAGRAGIGDGVFVVAYGTMGGAERLGDRRLGILTDDAERDVREIGERLHVPVRVLQEPGRNEHHMRHRAHPTPARRS